jgi:transcriptional regulator with XRE-family HTH domain
VDIEALRRSLLELRIRKGWSQGDLGREAGVRADTVSSIERGRHDPRPSTLRKLADALGVEVEDLFREPEAPKVLTP